MNRQQRRKQARELQRQQEFNRQYKNAVLERQSKVNDREMLVMLSCMALGVYDLYGNMPTRIQRIVEAFQKRLYEFGESDMTYYDLVAELKDKTGIEFRWKEDER